MSLKLRDVVAEYFRAHPGEWVSMQTLAGIAGTGGWRTRKNECERELGMRIENRQSRQQLADGRVIRRSEYKYHPAPLLKEHQRGQIGLGL